jgi:hypothetical protein
VLVEHAALLAGWEAPEPNRPVHCTASEPSLVGGDSDGCHVAAMARER